MITALYGPELEPRRQSDGTMPRNANHSAPECRSFRRHSSPKLRSPQDRVSTLRTWRMLDWPPCLPAHSVSLSYRRSRNSIVTSPRLEVPLLCLSLLTTRSRRIYDDVARCAIHCFQIAVLPRERTSKNGIGCRGMVGEDCRLSSRDNVGKQSKDFGAIQRSRMYDQERSRRREDSDVYISRVQSY